MRKSECFEHDIEVRNAWVIGMTAEDTALVKAMEPTARFELYRAIDDMVKTKYLETLRELNKDQTVLHIKGFGPVRQAKDQLPSDLRLSGIAGEITRELDFEALTKPKPVVEETEAESVSE